MKTSLIFRYRDRGVIEWRVRLVFPQATGGERDVQLDGVDDTTRIHDLFRPYVDTEEREADFEDPYLPYRLVGQQVELMETYNLVQGWMNTLTVP